jgi:hypothetical protein
VQLCLSVVQKKCLNELSEAVDCDVTAKLLGRLFTALTIS